MVKFHADEVSPGIGTGNAGRTGPHTVVQDHLAGVGVGLDEVFQQRDRFLRRVEARLSAKR